MEIIIIRKDMVTITHWAGGESRQYFIYPPNSSYSARDFSIRLSVATSTTNEEAKYTNLKNVTRHLIMIDGSTHVFHNNHYDLIMNPYEEIDVFDGGWESSAIGKVTDFGMMLGKDGYGKMSVVNNSGIISANNVCDNCKRSYNWLAFFCGKGKALFALLTGEEIEIKEYDMVIFKDIDPDFKLHLLLDDSKLVRMDICNYEKLS